MGDYSVKVQNRFAFLLEPLEDSESKPAKSKKKSKTTANNASESKEGKATASQRTEKAASTQSANAPSNAPTKEPTKRESAEVSNNNNNNSNNSKVNHQHHHSEEPAENNINNNNNNSSSGKPGSFGNRSGGGTNRNSNRPQNERRFDGNDRSGNYSFNNNNSNNKHERTQHRHADSQMKEETVGDDVASAVFSNNAPIPQWEDFSANTKKDNNKNDHISNGFMRDEFPQVEEFRPDNLDPKNQENDGSNQRNTGGFGNSRSRGGNFRGRGSRGAFRGRTFSRGGGGGFGTFRNDRPPPSYDGGENSFNDVDNNQEYGNENAGGAGFARGGFYGNRRGNYFDSRFSGARGGGGNRRYNNYRQSSNNFFDKRRPFDRPPRENRDAENNEQERVAEQNGDGVYIAQHQNANDGEAVTNGAEVNGGVGYDQKHPVNNVGGGGGGGGGQAAPQEEIGDWNAEVEKEEARRKETGEPALGASEETAFMSLEDFEAAQREKQRNTSFDVRKPGEGVNQFEGMRKINSSKVNESSTYPNNQLSSEPGTQLSKSNSGRMTKQNKLDIHFGPAPAKSAQTARSGGDRGSNFGGRSGGGYSERGYGGYGRGRGPRRGGGGGGGSGLTGQNFSDNRRANFEGPAPTFNNDTDFPILGEN